MNVIEGFVQLIPGKYEGNKPFKITDVRKVHLKCNCITGSILNGIQETILCSFGPTSAPGYKIYKEPIIKLFKNVNKTVLCHITFYLEDDDHKPVDCDGETVSFTYQLIEIQ